MTPTVKVNPRIQGIRDRTGLGVSPAEEVFEEPTKGVSEDKMKQVLAILRYQGPKTLKELAEYLPRPTAYNAALNLADLGAITAERDGKGPKAPYIFTYVMTPEGWILEGQEPIKKGAKDRDPADNPLTAMLAKKNPTVRMEAIESYEQLIRDTSGFYGPKELKDLVEAIHEICKIRIGQATVDCPVCGKLLFREGSGVYCKTCQRSYDAGDSAKSLEEYLRIANILKGGQ